MDHDKKSKQEYDEEFSRHLDYAVNYPNIKNEEKEEKNNLNNRKENNK